MTWPTLWGVGLLYGNGVFRQVIEDGWQKETYKRVDPGGLGAMDTGVVVQVPFPGRRVSARVWQVDVGRIPEVSLRVSRLGKGVTYLSFAAGVSPP